MRPSQWGQIRPSFPMPRVSPSSGSFCESLISPSDTSGRSARSPGRRLDPLNDEEPEGLSVRRVVDEEALAPAGALAAASARRPDRASPPRWCVAVEDHLSNPTALEGTGDSSTPDEVGAAARGHRNMNRWRRERAPGAHVPEPLRVSPSRALAATSRVAPAPWCLHQGASGLPSGKVLARS